LNGLDDLDNGSTPTPHKKLTNPKHAALYLPNVNQRVAQAVNKYSSSAKKTNTVAPTRGRVEVGSFSEKSRHNSVKSLPPNHQTPSKYYYKKHEFLVGKRLILFMTIN